MLALFTKDHEATPVDVHVDAAPTDRRDVRRVQRDTGLALTWLSNMKRSQSLYGSSDGPADAHGPPVNPRHPAAQVSPRHPDAQGSAVSPIALKHGAVCCVTKSYESRVQPGGGGRFLGKFRCKLGGGQGVGMTARIGQDVTPNRSRVPQ